MRSRSRTAEYKIVATTPYLPDQSAGTLSYGRQKLSTTAPTTLVAEYRTSAPADNQVKVEQYTSLDPACVAQVSTIVIAAGTTGDLCAVTVGEKSPPSQKRLVRSLTSHPKKKRKV